MRRTTLVGLMSATLTLVAVRTASAQGAWEVAQRCAALNNDPQYRPLLNEQVRENPAVILTASGGVAFVNSSVRDSTGSSRGGWGAGGNSIGFGGNAHLEAELGFLHPFWLRASGQFVAAGRMGFMGEVAAGFTLRNYGVYFVPAGASVSYSRYYVSVQTWNNHCTLRRVDFHGFTGIRYAGIFSRQVTDSNGMPVAGGSYDALGWIAPQLGLSFRFRYANGRSVEGTLAGMIDVTHLSGGAYARTSASYGPVWFGIDFGFFLPFDNVAGPRFSAWWSTMNLGVHFEI